MFAYSAQAIRHMDAECIRTGLYTGIELMTRAGNAAAAEIIHFAERTHFTPVFHIFTGSGNNGGDGFVIAARLAEQYGCDAVTLHAAVPEEKLKGDAAEAYKNMPEDLKKRIVRALPDFKTEENAIIIDCLLGTGTDLSNGLREPVKSLIGAINQSPCPVIAIDIPSGMCADRGIGPDGAVCAVETLTFAAPKNGFFADGSAKYCGKIRVLDIGIPEKIMTLESGGYGIFDLTAARKLFRKNDYDTYKQKRGSLLILGGSMDYPSAPFLAAEGALRTGAGMVTVAVPEQTQICCSVPKALIVRRLQADPERGCFCEKSIPAAVALAEKADAIVIGPGMMCNDQTAAFLQGFLKQIKTKPVLLDADALNALAKIQNSVRDLPNAILTPHIGEMNRLLAAEKDIEKLSPMGKAEALSHRFETVCVMKGPYSTSCFPIDRPVVNLSGSPALATAGSGDVLSGITGALMANQYPLADAAKLGVYLHGLCGEIAPEMLGNLSPDLRYPCGVIADDLINAIPRALRMIMGA